MWLYLPESSFAQASGCSERAPELHSSFSGTNTEPFATWSAKPLLPASLSRLWKRESLIRRLSGLTCSPSTVQRGADEWIASLPVSRVRIYPSQADAPDLTVSDLVSSSVSATLPTIAVRSCSFWRTSAPSLLPPPPLWTRPKANSKNAPPPESWENWPIEGGMRNGSLFPRPMWEPATAALDGSALRGEWLTPNVPNGGRSVSPEVVAAKGMTEAGKRTVGLESQTRHWPTPDASLHGGSNTSQGPAGSRPNISLAAKQWTTPTASERSGQGDRNRALRLDVDRWATPDCNTSTRSNGLMGPNIREQASQWTTPQAHDVTERGSGQRPTSKAGNACLARDARTWATPNAHDGRRPGADLRSTQGGNLSRDAAKWPTPAARDFKSEQGG